MERAFFCWLRLVLEAAAAAVSLENSGCQLSSAAPEGPSATGEPRFVFLAAAAEARYWDTSRAAASSSSMENMALMGDG